MRCQGWAKEGCHGALWEVMIGMEYLLNFFEEQNLIFSSPDSCISELRNFRVSATKRSSTQRIEQGRGREKHLPQHAREEYTDVVLQDENLDDDHRRCANSYFIRLPLFLHPRWNVSWLEANWTSDEQLVWLREAKNSVREFFEQYFLREEQPETSRTVTGKAVRQDEPSQFDQWMQVCDRCMMEEEGELGVNMRQGPVRRENLNPVVWWKDQQEEYPHLSKFALDILAIPAMSVGPERTFSVTKLTSALPQIGRSTKQLKHIGIREAKAAVIEQEEEEENQRSIREITTVEGDACGMAKMKRQVRRQRRIPPEKVGIRLAIVFHDISGNPGYTSAMLVTDRYSGYIWDYSLPDGSAPRLLGALKYLLRTLERQL
ncbi:hypothetical protein FOZG_18444 [Fusarium oxysporum Fo47]|uniref:HAT C-terminal dimerisation domain-containing protein n=1 Tax=Fusarium oxysporum Fo47 TaxID=660027 RepID=W9J7M7_FUSOX|nr:hypothetical protein FOZG_18444 [Fusarium oxysporum Fo47]